MNNQVIIVDSVTGNKWHYEIEPDKWDKIQAYGEWTDEGELVLDPKIIGALQKYSSDRALVKIKKLVDSFSVPVIEKPDYKEIDLPDLGDATHLQLEELLSYFGSWRSYLEARLGEIESERSVFNSTLEPALNKAMARLHTDERWDKGNKRPPKDIMIGIVLNENPQIDELQQRVIEADGASVRVRGMRDQFRTYYDAVSRVVALRTTFKENF